MDRNAVIRIVLLLSGMVLAATSVRADSLLIAVSTNFADTAEELRPVFMRMTGHQLRISTGSTGKLYAQISNGAPFHILLAADRETPARLEAVGMGVAGSRFTYALGRLAIWSRDPARINGDLRDALLSPDVRHIAIANPELAPYGLAARQTLVSLGLWETLKGRIVMGQNIGQTHAMVATGNAELGLIARSGLFGPNAPTEGSSRDVPQHLHEPIRQDAILLKAGADHPAASAFLAFLKSDEARTIIIRHGYGTE